MCDASSEPRGVCVGVSEGLCARGGAAAAASASERVVAVVAVGGRRIGRRRVGRRLLRRRRHLLARLLEVGKVVDLDRIVDTHQGEELEEVIDGGELAQDPHPQGVAAAVACGALARLRERGPRHVVTAEARLEERRQQLRVLGVEGGELYGVVAALVADEAAAVRRPEGRDGGAHLGRRQRGENHHEEVELLRRVRKLHGGWRRRRR